MRNLKSQTLKRIGILIIIGLVTFGVYNIVAQNLAIKKNEAQLKQQNTQLVQLESKYKQSTDDLEKEKAKSQQAEDENKKLQENNSNLESENTDLQGQLQVKKEVQQRQASVILAKATYTVKSSISSVNAYSYGYCTWYVKNRRPDIGSYWGDASNWLYSARADGYSTGSTPVVGAIAVELSENHVAYVESISGDDITISEMNYEGWGVVSYRTAPASSFSYIY